MLAKIKKFIQEINLSGVSIGTWVRTIMFVISIVLFVLKFFGYEFTVSEGNVEDIVIAVFCLISFLQSYWKNNSITKAAQEADQYLHEKRGEI